MTIIHKSKTQHQNADDLSKLSCKFDTIMFSVNVISDGKNLLKKIAKKLFIDRIFVKMMKKLNDQIKKIKNNEKNSSTKYQVYRLNFETDLLYVKNRSNFDKICIFEKCQKALFEYGHDQHAHDEIHRIYELLHRLVFMPKIKKLITDYIISCSACQFFKSSRQLFYEQLQSISFFSKSFSELSFDFIVILFVSSQKNNCILTMIDRFSKYIKIISDKKIMSAKK